MDNTKRLEELLKKVPDRYPGFAEQTSFVASKHNFTDRLVQFIEEHPDATTSDIVVKINDLLGIRKVSPQKTDQAAK